MSLWAYTCRSRLSCAQLLQGIVLNSSPYSWEWATSLRYEIDFYAGRREWKWTLWPYLLCRYSLLGAVISLLLELNAPGRLNCLAWAKISVLLTFSSILMASMLIAIRVIAIWNRHRAVVTLALSAMIVLLALLIHSVVNSHGMWDDGAKSCVLRDSAPVTLSILSATLAVDVILLLLMLYGLLRKREARRFSLWTFLLAQGILWFIVAIATEVPTVIVTGLNFNAVLSESLQAVGVLILSLAATRMYRSLTDFQIVGGRASSASDPPSGLTKAVQLAVLQPSALHRWPSRYPPIPANAADEYAEITVE
ncbi:hypothetical protein PENSPDRAFT_662557 [Peniophora sp. CONT]|nr:hypothetical protein PENSPDRAFT_662557 [Peniophora sp. CONT]